MRQIVLDTETTGLSPKWEDRIVEIGCVELIDRQITNRMFHRYVNPRRDIDKGALSVHGLSREFLSDKPVFANIVDDLVEFVDGAEVIIHNAVFDISFLDYEFSLLGRPPFRRAVSKVTDTLVDARQLFPGKRNSLDALSERLLIHHDRDLKHGTLHDAQLLAKVYLVMSEII